MSTKEERQYISESLMPEIKRAFEMWAKEYQQERDLGKLGEFASLYRKARKLKTLIWDEKGPAQPNGWRESERTIIIEVIAHGLLMLTDLDKERGAFARFLQELRTDNFEDDDEEEEPLTRQGVRAQTQSRRDRIGKRQARLQRHQPETLIGGDNGG